MRCSSIRFPTKKEWRNKKKLTDDPLTNSLAEIEEQEKEAELKERRFSGIKFLSNPELAEKIAEAKKDIDEDECLQNNALLRYHYPTLNVDELTDDQWAVAVAELHYVLIKENVLQKKII